MAHLLQLGGVTRHVPEKCYTGYTLWAPLDAPASGAEEPGQHPGTVYLMDMAGTVVHTWTTPYPTMYGYLQPNGNLLVGLRSTKLVPGRPGVGPHPLGGTQGVLVEMDWNGTILFQHEDLGMHHDFKKLPNGNYAYLAWERMPQEAMKRVRGGMAGTEQNGDIMWVDVIREVTPQGELVWEWHAREHLDYDTHIIGPTYSRHEWSHCNTLWLCEDGDYMSSSRYLDMAFKISRQTGDIVWSWGNAAYLDPETGLVQVRNSEKTLGGQHDVHIIPSGLPGAGHMLCYDNGMYKFVSRAVEVDMASGEVVWSSAPFPYMRGRVPFSPYISGARRQPNGNTLCCEGANGRFYEITPDLEIVWEYWRPSPCPYGSEWGVFRCFRYAPDYCPQFGALAK